MVDASNRDRALRIAVIGDVHNQWEDEDTAALHALQVDLALFVGDFGNESLEVVGAIAAVDLPKAVILGNHDAWYTATSWGRRQCPYDRSREDRVQAQLALLGAAHIGYGQRDFPELGLTVVGGRPFSWGGSDWKNGLFYRDRYGIHNWQESTARIQQAVDAATQDCLLFVGHCGPTGLGDQPESPCGRDWKPLGGDFGDPDLAAAIAYAHQIGKRVPLVTFGHMHHSLRHRSDIQRQRLCQDRHTGTVYLNAACVPRIVSSGADRLRNFSLVTLTRAGVQEAALVWVNPALTIADQELLLTPGQRVASLPLLTR